MFLYLYVYIHLQAARAGLLRPIGDVTEAETHQAADAELTECVSANENTEGC